MSIMAEALQPHIVTGLLSLGGRAVPGSLSDLLVAKSSSYDLDFDDMEQSISMDFRDSRTIIPALGSDCSRFATAAFQSIAPVSKEIVEKNTLAWSIVKLYYAAFYAGHSISGRDRTRRLSLPPIPAFPSESELNEALERWWQTRTTELMG